MGAFDDLIPQAPQAPQAPSTSGTFDDLIPKQAAPAAAPPQAALPVAPRIGDEGQPTMTQTLNSMLADNPSTSTPSDNPVLPPASMAPSPTESGVPNSGTFSDLTPGGSFSDLIPEPTPTVASGRATEAFGKSFAGGATNLIASVPRETAATFQGFNRKQVDVMDRIDRGETVPETQDPIGYQHMSPQQRQEFRVGFVPEATKPVSETPWWQLGQKIEQAGKFQMPPGYEGQTWTTDLGSGAGSMIAGMGLALIPFVGSELAGTAFLMSGREEARQRAQQAGASLDMQDRAAGLGTIAGATDLMDIVILKTGTIGKATGFIKKMGLKAIESAFIEGGQEGVQEFIQNAIEKGLYNPSKDLDTNVARSAAVGAILGFGAGGAIHAAQEGFRGRREADTTPQTPLTEEEINNAYKILTGGALDKTAPPTVPDGYARVYQIRDAQGNLSTTLDPAVAQDRQTKENVFVGWTDVALDDPAAKGAPLTPIQQGSLTPMMSGHQQLQSAQVLHAAQNIQQNVSEPIHGRGNVQEALGGPEVPGRIASAEEQAPSDLKVSLNQLLETPGLTTPQHQPAVIQAIAQVRRARIDAEDAARLYEDKIRNSPSGIVTKDEIDELNRLQQEAIRLHNEEQQLFAARRADPGAAMPEAVDRKGTKLVKVNDNIFVHPDVIAAAKGQKIGVTGNNIAATGLGMMVAIQRVAQKFGIRAKIQFELHTNALPSGGLGDALNLDNGRFRIRLSLATIMREYKENRTLHMQAVLMHELGHILMYERWSNASPDMKMQIQAAYDKFLEDGGFTTRSHMIDVLMRRDNAVSMYGRTKAGLTIGQLTQGQRAYWLGFSEWFAEQVARWGTTNERPINIVEKSFRGIANALKQLYAAVIQQVQGTPFAAENFRASKVMEDWLNHFVDHAPELSQDIYTEQQLREIETNGKLMPPGVPGVVNSPVTSTGMTATTGIIPPGTPIPPTAQPPQSPPPGPPPPPAGPGGAQPGGGARAHMAAMSVHASRMNKFYKYMASLSQLVTANPQFAPLARYYETVRAAHNEEARIQDMALRIAREWRGLAAQAENLTNFLNDLTNMVYRTPAEVAAGVARHPTQAELSQLMSRHNLSNEAVQTFQKIKILFDGFLQMNKQVAIETAQRIAASMNPPTNPMILLQQLQQINQHFADMASRPYFPFMRFGRHYVVVKDAAGRVVHFETAERLGFRSAESRQRALHTSLEQQYPGHDVRSGLLPEEAEPFIGLPPSMLESIKNNLTLTPSQAEALQQLMLAASPAMSFKHQMQRKNYIPGYSMEFRRSFARYFFHGARYYARSKYAWLMREHINSANGISVLGDKIRDFMQDHFQNTIIDARGDWGMVKGAMFLWAMGYVPAAATQNLSQTAMISLPFFGAKFGDIRAAKALMAAMKDLDSYYKKGTYDAAVRAAAAGGPPVSFMIRSFDYGLKTGRISESQAAELAGMAGGGNLVAGIGGNKAERGWIQFQEKAAWMFEMAEQFNRRISWRAAINLAMQNPNAKGVREAVSRYNDEYHVLQRQGYTPAEAAAIVTAAYSVDQTQYVYARYDRPRFMRGFGSTLTVFMRYLQSTLFMLAQNPTDILPRYLLVAMAIGGLGGIPGYDDLKEILKAAAARWFGKHFNLDAEITRYVMNLSGGRVPADLVLHGFARKGLGIPALLDMLGSLYTGVPGRGLSPDTFHSKNVPFPAVDRSKALTSSHILPFELGKLFYPQKDMNSVIADQTQKASGAMWSLGFNMYKFLNDSKLEYNDPKRWERIMPREMAALSKMFRTFNEGRERSGDARSGTTVARYNWRDPEQAMEMLAMGGGYRPLREAQHWDSVMYEREAEAFHDFRKSQLLEQKFQAIQGGIPAEVQTVQADIDRYNKMVRDTGRPSMQITAETQMKSVQKRALELNARESGTPTRKTNIPIAREAQKLFPYEVDRRKAP